MRTVRNIIAAVLLSAHISNARVTEGFIDSCQDNLELVYQAGFFDPHPSGFLPNVIAKNTQFSYFDSRKNDKNKTLTITDTAAKHLVLDQDDINNLTALLQNAKERKFEKPPLVKKIDDKVYVIDVQQSGNYY